jgi:hypothetical protein
LTLPGRTISDLGTSDELKTRLTQFSPLNAVGAGLPGPRATPQDQRHWVDCPAPPITCDLQRRTFVASTRTWSAARVRMPVAHERSYAPRRRISVGKPALLPRAVRHEATTSAYSFRTRGNQRSYHDLFRPIRTGVAEEHPPSLERRPVLSLTTATHEQALGQPDSRRA